MPAESTTGRAASLPPQERRAAIIEAVRPLLAEFGESITSRQIAQAAGVAEGTVFRAFVDKDDLLSATLEAALDTEMLERALAEIDPEVPFEDRVGMAVVAIQERLVDVMALVAKLGPRLSEQATRPLAGSEALTALFASEGDRLSVEPARAARMLKALTLSMTHPMLVGESVSASEIAAMFLHGIETTR